MNHSHFLPALPIAFLALLILIYKRPQALMMNTILTAAFAAVSGGLLVFAGYSLFGLIAFLFGMLVLPIIPAAAADDGWR